jgi:hypothetical protein
MQIERRRTARHLFEGAIEVTAETSGERLVSVTEDIGLFGCSVKAAASFPTGTKISLKITHGGKTFAAPGVVAYVVPNAGMGIAYGTLAPGDYAVLQEWLAQ